MIRLVLDRLGYTRFCLSAGHLYRNLSHSSLPGYGVSLTGLVTRGSASLLATSVEIYQTARYQDMACP